MSSVVALRFIRYAHKSLPYLKIARFDHYIKQLFILPGMLFAFALIKIADAGLVSRLLWGMTATCWVASANYIINEWLDADFDQYHPTKKNRPLVCASIQPCYIIVEYFIFAFVGLLSAWFASKPVFIAVSSLFFMGIVYNVPPVRSKEIPYIDVLSESVNNAIRLLIGWFIVTGRFLPPVSIILGYWMGGAFLMAAKRFAEYRMIGEKSRAALYRKSFKYYSEESLLLSAFFYAMLSVFFCGIFMLKYRIEFVLAIPFLCGLFCIYLDMCYKPDSAAQKPEKLFKEKGLFLYVLFFIMLFVALLFFKLPFLRRFLETSFLVFEQ